jgi:hypothetical protein
MASLAKRYQVKREPISKLLRREGVYSVTTSKASATTLRTRARSSSRLFRHAR